jgi:hypothetical protein
MTKTQRTLIAVIALSSFARAASLTELREMAAKSAEREVAALASVACTETLVATKINRKNKTEERRRQTFDYVALVDTEGGELVLTESRIEQGKTKSARPEPLLATTGFATMLLIFHPYYQNSFEFSDLGSAEDGGRQWRRLGFEFRPGQRSPSVLRSGAREYPLAWKGELLIDEKTGQVASIHAALGSQLEEVGLQHLDATVHFGPQPRLETAEWLPTEATIDLETRHQHWHNVHTFGSYKRFDVSTTEKQEAPKKP